MKPTRSLRAALGFAALAATLAAAPAAQATITPTVMLDQSAGTQAGSDVALGVDIHFAPSSSSDSPKTLTLALPPGLLADATLGAGACIATPPPPGGLPASDCKVGTGAATAVVGGAIATTQNISLYLVAPPNTSDLAGLAIYLDSTSQQLGTPGDVTVRPSGDPAGVGVDITTVIPNSISLGGGPPASLSVSELQTTLSAIRMPDSCPSTPANFTVSADSYMDPTVKTTMAPLNVTGCSNLQLTPAFTVTAAKDSADNGVAVTTEQTQPSAATQATSSQVVLTLPPNVLQPNVTAVLNGGLQICTDPTFASCTPIGTATTSSPLYPSALTANAYLNGSVAAPQIALHFGSPFPITLTGSVSLSSGSTTFTGVPTCRSPTSRSTWRAARTRSSSPRATRAPGPPRRRSHRRTAT